MIREVDVLAVMATGLTRVIDLAKDSYPNGEFDAMSAHANLNSIASRARALIEVISAVKEA